MRKVVLFIVSMFLIGVLVACGDSDPEAEEVETVGDDIADATELTFWTFAGTHADFFINAAERAME